MQRLRASIALLLLAPLLAGCGPYLFRQSDRLQIVTPQNNGSVHQPVTIRWRAQDFNPPQDGRFAVFVDRDPMTAGGNIGDYTAQERAGIYLVDTTSVRLSLLTPLSGVDPAEQNHHDVTVVMLDRNGSRIGEYAGFAEFTVVR